MKTSEAVTFFALLVSVPVWGQSAQTLVIPQVVDGGGWQSTIVLTNSNLSTASATLTFQSDTSGGGTQPWTPSFLEVGSTNGMSLNAGSSLFLHTPGTAATLTQGFAQLSADAGISAYVIYTNRVPGRQDQDATAPAVAASNRILVPYDDAAGNVTAIAIVNPTGAAQAISVGFRTVEGAVTVSNLPSVPPQGHLAFVLSQQFPVIAAHRGLAEFYSPSGNFSVIALRFNNTLSFTSVPVLFQYGAPIITAPNPGSGGDPYNPDPYNPYASTAPGNGR